eukprot:763731-Hanusia_phi.AAC.3
MSCRRPKHHLAIYFSLLLGLCLHRHVCRGTRAPSQPSLLFPGRQESVRFRKLHDQEPAQETFEPPFNQALNSIHEHVEHERQADGYGSLGLPPRSSHIVIDGASVAWSYGQRVKFSCRGLKKALDFFLEQGYENVIALVGYAYTQEPPKGSNRTRVADNTDALLAMKLHGHALFMPPGANEESMLLQYAFMRDGFVVSNNDFSDFKRSCNKDEEEWVRTHHIYFTWIESEFLPMCERDDKPAKPLAEEERGDEDGLDHMQDVEPEGDGTLVTNGEGEAQGQGGENPFLSWRILVPDGGLGLLQKLTPLSLFNALKVCAPPIPPPLSPPLSTSPPAHCLHPPTVAADAESVAGEKAGPSRQHAAEARDDGAAEVVYLEGRFGVIESVNDEIVVQGGTLEDETTTGMRGELLAFASPDLLRGRILPVGTSVEFDAVCDLPLRKWIVTRLVRTGCVKDQEQLLTRATSVLAGLLGHTSVEEFSYFWQQHGAQDVSAVSMQLEGRVFSTTHLLMNKAYFCRGLSAPACVQELFEPDEFVTDSARNVGLPTTVEEFFRSRHSPLAFPHLPCLCALASDGQTILFFPLEVCRIQFQSPTHGPTLSPAPFQQHLYTAQVSPPTAQHQLLFEKLEEYFKRQEELVSTTLNQTEQHAAGGGGAGAPTGARKQTDRILRKLHKAINRHTTALEKRFFHVQMNQAMEVDRDVKDIIERDNLTLADYDGNESNSMSTEEHEEHEELTSSSELLESSRPQYEEHGESNSSRYALLEARTQKDERTIMELKDELKRRDAVLQSLTNMLHDASKGRPSVRARCAHRTFPAHAVVLTFA